MLCIAKPITLALFILISPHLMAETAYKWTDAEGKIHFSSTPPKGALRKNAEKFDINAPNRSSTPLVEKKKAQPEKPKISPKEQLIENCKQTQNNINMLKNEGPVSIKDEDGTTRMLSDTERMDNQRRNKDYFTTNCKDLPGI